MKSPLTILVVVIVVAASIGLIIKYNQETQSAQGQLNNERYSRMIAEENLEKTKADLVSRDSELSRIKNKLSVIEKSLEQTKVVNDDLKSRLDQAAQLKNNLEAKIQELNSIAGGGPINPAVSVEEIPSQAAQALEPSI